MGDIVLATRITPPPPRPDALPRLRLLERLAEGRGRRFTLIVAPAGYGKTTLAAAFVRQQPEPVAWLSLEPEDSRPTRFITYLIAALQRLQPDIGARVARLPPGAAPQGLDIPLQMLANDLAELPAEPTRLLVLDDCHHLENAALLAALGRWLDRLPPQLHVILLSRGDPPFPLARWRGRGELAELRLADLAFDLDEAAAFVRRTAPGPLPPGAVAALHERTEGWPTGLQLAALTLDRPEDIPAGLLNFAGTHRHVVDYLGDEVLARLPPGLADFLRRTAILEQLCAPLCAAVTGLSEAESAALLTEIERRNLFLIPLDDERRWFRYHHLFGEFLADRLTRSTSPAERRALLERVARWFAGEGALRPAIAHALRGEAFELAADWLLALADALWTQGETDLLVAWLDALPPQMAESRPLLAIYRAWTLFFAAQSAADGEPLLRRGLAALGNAERRLSPAAKEPAAWGMLLAARTALTSLLADPEETIALGERALALLPEAPSTWRSVALISLAFAYRRAGATAEALTTFEAAARAAVNSRNFSGAWFATDNWGSLLLDDDRAAEAEAVYRAGLEAARQNGAEALPITGILYVGLGRALLELGRPAEAIEALEGALERFEAGFFPTDDVRWLLKEVRRRPGQTAANGRPDPARRPHPYLRHTLRREAGAPPAGLPEPLTERELEVLRGLANGLSNAQIAARLVIAVGTVKKHTSNIYAKLGVRGRTQAVLRAQALGLLP